MITRIRQAMGDLLAEIYSWLRWIYHKNLPSWLSAPFRFPIINILYILAITALILFYLPSGVWPDLIRQVLHDIWVKNVGEGSVPALTALLAGFQTHWGLPVIGVLFAWGLIAWRWAWPRQNFYKTLEDAGVVVLRGPGERLLFLNRLFEHGVGGLGRGPSARILPTYIPRDEDTYLRQRMRALRHHRRDLGVFVTGPASSGKTRTAMELIAALRPALVLVWPRGGETSSWQRLPTWRIQAIIIADNLGRAASGGDVPLPASLVQLLQQCPRLLLVGTIRKDMLTKDLRGLEAVELIEMDKAHLQVLANEVAKAESISRGHQVDASEILHRYNGHPAGLVVGLDAMREIYNKLEPGPRAFLQAARLLWLMGVRSLTLERLWESVELINRMGRLPGVRQELLERLTDPGLITQHENGQARVEIYESYLDQVIDSPYEQPRLEKRILALWRKRGDAQAFVEHGDVLTDEYSLSYQQDPQNALRLGISAYREALHHYTPECAPLDYAMTQNNLGVAYSDLAAHQEPAGNLSRAIQAYTEALRYRTPKRAPLDYAMTQNNLGVAYIALAAHQEPAENLGRGIQAYTEALRYRTPKRAPLDYAMTQNNLGIAYSTLAVHQEPAENLGRAIQACTEALHHYTPERAPLQYATTQNNLGNDYSDLSAHQEPAENLERAIQAYTEALRYRTPERAPLQYATTQHNLGIAYFRLAAHQKEKGQACAYLKKSLQAYAQALHYLTQDTAPLLHVKTLASYRNAQERVHELGCDKS